MRRTLTLLSASALVAGMLVIPASADHDGSPGFELDGNVANDGHIDWEDFFEPDADGNITESPLPAGFIASGASADHFLPDTTTFTQGSKDTLDVDQWSCTTKNNVNNKVDITNAYTAAERNDDGELIIYFGAEIRAPEGNSNIGVWFLQNEAECEGSQAFTGQHAFGDVLVVAAFTGGGTHANIDVYRWVGSGGSHGPLDLAAGIPDALCTDDELGDDEACAIANSEHTVETPWFSPDRRGNDEPLAVNTFFEGGVNITAILDTDPADECFTHFLTNTRSSQSLTATLHDYTIGELAICGGLTVVKETDPEGEDQDFDFEIVGPGIEGTGTFQLNAADHDAPDNPDRVTFTDLLIGTYTITEVDIPSGWDLTAIACDNGATVDLAAGEVQVEVGVAGSVTCTFTNTLRHSILIEKTYDVDPGADNFAAFALHEDVDGEPGDKVGDLDHTHVTNGDDQHFYCIDDLVPGVYWVVETTTPTGFASNDDVEVTTSSTQTCADRVGGDGLISEADGPDATIDNLALDVDLTVTKWKTSMDDDGELFRSDVKLDGFVYTLYEGEDDEGEAVATSTTGAGGDGVTDFDEGVLEVGTTYTVCETGVPTYDGDDGYWTASDCQTFTPVLDTDVALDFDNAPRADVTLTFDDVTGYTSATIVCTTEGSEGEITLADEHFGHGEGGGTVNLDKLDLGDYSCDIEIRNGAAPPPPPSE